MLDIQKAEVREVFFPPIQPDFNRKTGLRLPEEMKADAARETRRMLVESLQRLSEAKFALSTIVDLIDPEDRDVERVMKEYPEFARALLLGENARSLFESLETLIASLEEALGLSKGWHNLESDEGQLE